MYDYEKPKRTGLAIMVFNEKLIEELKIYSKYKGEIRELKHIIDAAITRKNETVRSHNRRMDRASQKYKKCLEKIVTKGGQYEIENAALDTYLKRHDDEVDYKGIGHFSSSASIEDIANSIASSLYKEEPVKEVVVKPEKIEQETRRSEPIYPRADVSYSDVIAISSKISQVDYFLNNLKGRQFERHINNIKKIIRGSYRYNEVDRAFKGVWRNLEKIEAKNKGNELRRLAGLLNTIYHEHYTEDNIISEISNKILFEMRMKAGELDRNKPQVEEQKREEPKVEMPKPEVPVTRPELVLDTANYEKLATGKKQFDELYKKGKFQPLAEYGYQQGTVGNNYAALVNHYYDARYDQEIDKHNISYSGVNNLFELAKDLADDIFKRTVLSAQYDTDEYGHLLRNAFALYSLETRMAKFEKYSKQFYSVLDKLDENKKAEVIAEFNRLKASYGLEPTKAGILINVANQEKEYILKNEERQAYNTALNQRDPGLPPREYSLTIIATHIPIDQLPGVYQKLKNGITEDKYFYSEAQMRLETARQYGESKQSIEHLEAEAKAAAEKHSENKSRALTALQQEFSQTLLAKLSDTKTLTTEQVKQLEALVCQKYLGEEPLFIEKQNAQQIDSQEEAHISFVEAKARRAATSKYNKIVQDIISKKPKKEKTKEEIALEEAGLSGFNI